MNTFYKYLNVVADLPNIPMSTKNVLISTFIMDLLHEKNILPSHLASVLGVSHATVGRWLKGEDIPNARSCYKVAIFSGTSIEEVLRIAGHIPPGSISENKYPGKRGKN